MRGLHVIKIANIGAILRPFATGNEEQRLHQPSDTVGTTEQLVHARVGASELAATSADKFTSSARGLQVAKIADGSVILQLAAKKKAYRNCPARLASVGNETTHVQLRQSKLQPLQLLCINNGKFAGRRNCGQQCCLESFMRTPAKKNVRRNCPARLAPVGNEKTHVQLRQSKLKPLQTLVHHQWGVCRSQKLLTAVLFRKFMRAAAKGEAYSNCPAWLAPLATEKHAIGLAAHCCCNQ